MTDMATNPPGSLPTWSVARKCRECGEPFAALIRGTSSADAALSQAGPRLCPACVEDAVAEVNRWGRK